MMIAARTAIRYTMSVLEIAPNARFSVLEGGLRDQGTNYRFGGVRGYGTPSTQFDVINQSFGIEALGERADDRGGGGVSRVRPLFQDLLGVSSTYLTNTGDAVIVRSAGNDNTDAGYVVNNIALIDHDSTGPRGLIVGALDQLRARHQPAEPNQYIDQCGVSVV